MTKADIAESAQVGVQNLSAYRETMRPFITTSAFSLLEKAAAAAPKPIRSADGDVDVEIPLLQQPRGLASSVTLREYQRYGVSWLVHQYNRGINSILADEMGAFLYLFPFLSPLRCSVFAFASFPLPDPLSPSFCCSPPTPSGLGKTIQSIAFLSHVIQTEKQRGPHLVVVPLSVLFNWMQEFKKFCPTIKVIRLHANDKKEQNRMKDVICNASLTEVVVTTYDLVKQGDLMKTLREICWNTIILDEGHRIKNDESKITQAAQKLKARFRLILTGTPVQVSFLLFRTLVLFSAQPHSPNAHSFPHPNLFRTTCTRPM